MIASSLLFLALAEAEETGNHRDFDCITLLYVKLQDKYFIPPSINLQPSAPLESHIQAP